jgi:hypothetical protein
VAWRPLIAVYLFRCRRCQVPYNNWLKHTCYIGLAAAQTRKQREWDRFQQRGRQPRVAKELCMTTLDSGFRCTLPAGHSGDHVASSVRRDNIIDVGRADKKGGKDKGNGKAKGK